MGGWAWPSARKNLFQFHWIWGCVRGFSAIFAAVNAKVLTTFRKSFCRVRRRQELVLLGVVMGGGVCVGVAVGKEEIQLGVSSRGESQGLQGLFKRGKSGSSGSSGSSDTLKSTFLVSLQG